MIMAVGSSLGSSFSEQSPAEPGRRVLSQQRRDVGVCAGDPDIGVAEHFLNHGQRLIQPTAGVGRIRQTPPAECFIQIQLLFG